MYKVLVPSIKFLWTYGGSGQRGWLSVKVCAVSTLLYNTENLSWEIPRSDDKGESLGSPVMESQYLCYLRIVNEVDTVPLKIPKCMCS